MGGDAERILHTTGQIPNTAAMQNNATSTRTSLEPSFEKEKDGVPDSAKDERNVISCLHRPVVASPSEGIHSFSNGPTSVASPHIDATGAA